MAGDSFYEAYVEVIPTAKGFERSLNRQLAGPSAVAGGAAGGAAGGGFVAGFGKAIPLIGGVLAAAGLGSMIGDAIQNGSDYSQAQSAVEDVFGRLGADAIQAFAEGGATSVGQSLNDILAGSTSFGIFGKAAGLADKELVDFSTNLITLGADLSAFANTSPQEAVEAISAGLRGESEPLRKYGVLLDDATLRMKALELGIYDGNGSLTQQQRILAANGVIFDQTAIQQGKFAAESDSLAGRQAVLAASMENVSTQIGTALLPVTEAFVGFLLTEGVPALEEFAAWFTAPETQAGFEEFGIWLGEVGAGFDELGASGNVASTSTRSFFDTLGAGGNEASAAIREFGMAALGALDSVDAKLTEGREQVSGFIGTFGEKLALGRQQIWDFAGDVGAGTGMAIGFFQSLPGKIGDAIGGLGSMLYNSGRAVLGSFLDGLNSRIADIRNAISGAMSIVAGAFPNSPADWGPLSGAGWSSIKSAGVAISNQFASGIASDYSRVRASTAGLVSAALPDLSNASISGTLAIGFPSARVGRMPMHMRARSSARTLVSAHTLNPYPLRCNAPSSGPPSNRTVTIRSCRSSFLGSFGLTATPSVNDSPRASSAADNPATMYPVTMGKRTLST